MPTSITVNGRQVYKPGFYGRYDASALGGKTVSKGNVAVVGAFPGFKQNTPVTFTNPKACGAFDPSDQDLQRVAKLAFSPSKGQLDNGTAIGGANTLTIVNVQANTVAKYIFKDIAGNDSLVLTSYLYGTKGNHTYAKLKANATDNHGLDVLLVRDGTSETYTNLQSGVAFTVRYTGGELTTAVFSASPTEWKWSFTKAMAALGGISTPQSSVYTPSKFLISGKLTVALSGAAPTEGVIVTVVGINAAGVPKTLSHTFAVGESTGVIIQDGSADALWSALTSVTVATTNADSTIVATISGDAIVLDPTKFNYVGQMVSLINNNAAKGFVATAVSTSLAVIPATQIDKQTTQDTIAGALSLRADLWAIVKGLSKSALVSAARATTVNAGYNADLPTKHYNQGSDTAEEVMLLGGTASTVSVATDYAGALATIEASNIAIVAVLEDDIEAGKALITHCDNSAVAGFERNGWYGAPVSTSLSDMLTARTAVLNTRHVAVCGQEIQVAAMTTGTEWLPPRFQAVQCAGLQAGLPRCEPLTEKRPDVDDVRASWSVGTDDNEVIQKGICAYTKDDLGVKVLRSVTSYLTDDNPIYSEVSANESGNLSIRGVRAAMDPKIGAAGTRVSANSLMGPFIAELKKQVKEGTIKAYRDEAITDGGDRYSFDYGMAAVEPFNFGDVTAHVYRTA